MKKMTNTEYWSKGELRKRYPMKGAEGFQVGDFVHVKLSIWKPWGSSRTLKRWMKRDKGWKAVIIERYATHNSNGCGDWINPHYRVEILQGLYKGKVVCVN